MNTVRVWPCILLAGAAASAALAQDDPDLPPPLPSVTVAVNEDSGPVLGAGDLEAENVVYSTVVHVPGAAWLRLSLDGTTLSGDPGADGSRLRVTSLADGAVQVLNAEHLGFWSNTSAYFNGDAVAVEVLSREGESRLVIPSVIAGQPAFGERSICFGVDDRQLSTDPRAGRLMSVGCSAWLINDLNGGVLTAGHCGVSASSTMQFNVPLSLSNGTYVAPPPDHQYPLEIASSQGNGGGVGADWRYFGCNVNANTGWTARQAQGSAYTLAAAAPPVSGQTIRITGYGTVSAPVSLTWNGVQKTHTGPYTLLSGTTVRYQTDTTGGNSGSAVEIDGGNAIGIHTHAGCNSGGGSNQGTAIHFAALQNALNNPLGLCRSGRGAATGNLFAIGDAANNLGVLSTTTGVFDATTAVGRWWQGLAYDQENDAFLAVNTARELWTINPGSGAAALLGTVTGTTLTFTGLAFNPATRTLYGFTSTSGQLWTINLTTFAAASLSPASALRVAAMDWSPADGAILAIDDAATGSRLVRLSPATGGATVVGNLGAGIVDCNGLAVDPVTGDAFTINASNDQLLRVSRATGAATVIGPTLGAFGASYGMAFRAAATLPCTDIDFNNDMLMPDNADVEAFLAVFGGAPCPTASCDSIDFNGDGLFPDNEDIEDFVRVFGGGSC
ncbi:MAG TPA: hypothetical protein VD971_11755 [Phycisphaerales bacterium]|nr:hypothetical protein [Phycisphaerales bacterium]